MKFKQMISKIKNLFCDALFPNDIKCVLCGVDLPDDDCICENCKKEDIFNNGNRCVFCDTQILEGNIVCDHCKNRTRTRKGGNLAKSRYYDKCFCPLNYKNRVRSAILKLKSDGAKYLAPHFAKLIYDHLKTENVTFDIIVPVPSHAKTIKKRGYNPAKVIADELGKLCSKPVKDFLVKNVLTSNQKFLDYESRQNNLKDSMIFTGNIKEIKGKNILLVDDVITTCATINTCASLLTKAKKIYACSVARNQLH